MKTEIVSAWMTQKIGLAPKRNTTRAVAKKCERCGFDFIARTHVLQAWVSYDDPHLTWIVLEGQQAIDLQIVDRANINDPRQILMARRLFPQRQQCLGQEKDALRLIDMTLHYF